MARLVVCVAAALAALPAVVLTAARLAGGSNRQLGMVQAFAPWAIPVYVLVLVLLGSLLVRRAERRPRRRPVALAGLASGALLALHVGWAAPSLLGATPEADPDAPTLTVMTSNLRFGEADAREVIRAAETGEVDVLVLQEVTPEAVTALEEAGIGALFAHRGGQALPGALGTMAFSRTPVTDPERVATEMGTWLFRTAGLRLMAVHPAYPLDADWGDELALLRAAILEAEPDVVAGDFNASTDHAPLRAILETGLRDAAELANSGWQPTWPTNGYDGLPVPPSVAIDHVLVGPDLTALRTTTVDISGTDHRALLATVAPTAAP